MRRRRVIAVTVITAGAALLALRGPLWVGAVTGTPGAAQTVADVLDRYSPAVEKKFAPRCRAVEIAWPPRRVQLLAFKQERVVEVWAANADGPYHRLATYPVLAASGTTGPKRGEGDLQVPEGFYRLSALNPNSAFHLSLRVSYPNATDIRHADVPRAQMGGDIYVHGGAASTGCLALGDPAIEEVFCLVACADPAERRILIAPADLRRTTSVPPGDAPWVRALYARLRTALFVLPAH